MFSSLLGMKFDGISSGSASQLELAAAADVRAGSDAVLSLAWSDFLDFFATGASVFLAASRFLLGAIECVVRI